MQTLNSIPTKTAEPRPIGRTSEYGLFSFDGSNRPVDAKHVASLTEAIRDNNLLANYPIVVDHHGTILDGQHRYLAAKRLGVPVYYVQSEDAGVVDIATTTALVKSWQLEDYLHHYCALGLPEYIKLRLLIERNPGFPMTVYIRHTQKHTKGGPSAFKAGQYFCEHGDRFESLLAAVLALATEQDKPWLRSSGFVSACVALRNNRTCDWDSLMQRLREFPSELTRCSNHRTYIELLVGIYNRGRHHKNRIKR